jgi:hypothetical protein
MRLKKIDEQMRDTAIHLQALFDIETYIHRERPIVKNMWLKLLADRSNELYNMGIVELCNTPCCKFRG